MTPGGRRPDFGLLQSRTHFRSPSERLPEQVTVLYYVFDLLHQGDESLLGLSYIERRARLEQLDLNNPPIQTPTWWEGGGADVLAASIDNGLEGVVGKPLTSRHQPGKRRDWIKVKNVRTQEG